MKREVQARAFRTKNKETKYNFEDDAQSKKGLDNSQSEHCL